MTVKCPLCGSADVRWSRSGNESLPLLLQLFLVAGRCPECGRTALWRGPLLLGPALVANEPARRRPEEPADTDAERSFSAAETAELSVVAEAAVPSPFRDSAPGDAAVALETAAVATLEISNPVNEFEPVSSTAVRPRRTVPRWALPCGILIVVASCAGAWWTLQRSQVQDAVIPPTKGRISANEALADQSALELAPTVNMTDRLPRPTAAPETHAQDPAALSALAPVPESRFRVWQDANHTRSVRARLLSVAGDQATFLKEDGSQVTVPVSGLSADDQAYLREQSGAASSATTLDPAEDDL